MIRLIFLYLKPKHNVEKMKSGPAKYKIKPAFMIFLPNGNIFILDNVNCNIVADVF